MNEHLQTPAAADRKAGGTDNAQRPYLAQLHSGYYVAVCPHVHVHCIVTLGGLALDGSQWVDSPAGMLDGASLADPFRTLYVQGLKRLIAKRQLFIPKHLLAARDEESFLAWLKPLEAKQWRVHMTPPSSRYAGPEAALKYVASYVKGAAIGNRRIISDDGVNVSFYYKDYRCNKQIKIETISGVEFVRRFLLHVTPPRFLRVRHRGIFANAQQKRDLARCRKLFGVGDEPAQEDSAQPDAAQDERQADVLRAPDCPRCGEPNMVWIGEILPTADWHLRRYGYFARRTRGSGLRPPSTRAP